jgi:serine/threonine-protein phosphatase 2B catalytic subunit
VVDAGYKEHDFLTRDTLCITIFSAPNYCDLYENQGAVLAATKDGYSFRQYTSVKHPFYLPDFSDAFSYAVPFLMENLVFMLSEMVIDIKEEDPDSLSKDERKMNADMEAKAKKLRLMMATREKKDFQSAKKRTKVLAADHPNMSLFERALSIDKANEQAPRALRRKPLSGERGLKRQNSLKW